MQEGVPQGGGDGAGYFRMGNKNKKANPFGLAKLLILLVGPVGFEPTTYGLRVRCSTS